MTYYEPRHAKPAPPFLEAGTYKVAAAVIVITVSAGPAAAGGAIPTYHHGTTPYAAATYHYESPSAAYGVAAYDHADPLHSDPAGEWIRVATADYSGTATTFPVIGTFTGGNGD